MKKILNTFLILSTAVLLTACPSKNDKGEEKPIYYLNQQMKDYVIFPVGSWWVYEDSAIGVLDTITVTHSNNKMVDRRNLDIIYEYQLIKYNSSYYNTEILAGSGGQGAIRYSENPPPTFIPTVMFFSSDEADSASLYTGYLVREKRDSLEIKDSIYSKVLQFTTTKFQHNLLPEFTYYAPHVGLIRKQLFNGTVWNLKTYFINQ